MVFALKRLPNEEASTAWNNLPPKMRVLHIANRRKTGVWLAEAFATDSASEVDLQQSIGSAAGLARLRDEVFDAVLVSHEPGSLDALEEMIDIIHRFRIRLPPQVAMLLKVFITLEGTSRLLCPTFSLLQVIQRYHRTALLRRWSPARRLRKLHRIYGEMERLVEVLPRRIVDILEQVQAGRFDVHLDHRGLEPSVNRP